MSYADRPSGNFTLGARNRSIGVEYPHPLAFHRAAHQLHASMLDQEPHRSRARPRSGRFRRHVGEGVMARLLSVNVGLLRDIAWQGKTVQSVRSRPADGAAAQYRRRWPRRPGGARR